MGYTIDAASDEIDAQLFVPFALGLVTYQPTAAYGSGLPAAGGWYTLRSGVPQRRMLWQVRPENNRRSAQPLTGSDRSEFTTSSDVPFGLWVASTGFPGETVYTQDNLQRFIFRFKPTDRHKARVFPLKVGGRTEPGAYVVAWEYSDNNDFQDVVSVVHNARPYLKK